MLPPTLIETHVFQRRADSRLGDEGRLALAGLLAENPEAGVVEPGTGGLRKVRLGMQGRGKRGGARIIYFYAQQNGVILLLTVYAKNESAALSAIEKKVLRRVVRAEFGK